MFSKKKSRIKEKFDFQEFNQCHIPTRIKLPEFLTTSLPIQFEITTYTISDTRTFFNQKSTFTWASNEYAIRNNETQQHNYVININCTPIIYGQRNLIVNPRYGFVPIQQLQLSFMSRLVHGESFEFSLPARSANLYPTKIAGIEFLVENQSAEKAIESALPNLFRSKIVSGKEIYFAPKTLRTLVQLTQSSIETGRVSLHVFDVKQVGSDAAAYVSHHRDGFKQAFFRSQTNSLVEELCHEWTHTTLQLANPQNSYGWLHDKYAHQFRQAICKDFWIYKKNLPQSNVVKQIGKLVFKLPQSYPVKEHLAERLAFSIQGLARNERAVRFVAPNFLKVLDEYVAEEAKFMVPFKACPVIKPAPNLISIGKVGIKGGLGVIWALDVLHKYKHEKVNHPKASTLSHKMAVATDVLIDLGLVGCLSYCTPGVVAKILVLFSSTGMEISHKLQQVTEDEIRDSRALFMAQVFSYDLSPEAESQMITAFDRGEKWTRESNVNTFSFIKASTKPLAKMYELKQEAVNLIRRSFY